MNRCSNELFFMEKSSVYIVILKNTQPAINFVWNFYYKIPVTDFKNNTVRKYINQMRKELISTFEKFRLR